MGEVEFQATSAQPGALEFWIFSDPGVTPRPPAREKNRPKTQGKEDWLTGSCLPQLRRKFDPENTHPVHSRSKGPLNRAWHQAKATLTAEQRKTKNEEKRIGDRSEVTVRNPLPPISTLPEYPPTGAFYTHFSFSLLPFLRVLCGGPVTLPFRLLAREGLDFGEPERPLDAGVGHRRYGRTVQPPL